MAKSKSRAPIKSAVAVSEALKVEEALRVSVAVGVSVRDVLLVAEGVMVEDEVVVGVWLGVAVEVLLKVVVFVDVGDLIVAMATSEIQSTSSFFSWRWNSLLWLRLSYDQWKNANVLTTVWSALTSQRYSFLLLFLNETTFTESSTTYGLYGWKKCRTLVQEKGDATSAVRTVGVSCKSGSLGQGGA
jgi:hypothetical protein